MSGEKQAPRQPTLLRPNYGSASTRPKVATALLQTVDRLASIDLVKAMPDRKLARPPQRGRRWTSSVADHSYPGRQPRGLPGQANPSHRLRVEHDAHTLLIHLSGDDGSSWTTMAVDRA